MAKKPLGSGKWQRTILADLDEHPCVMLVPPGAPETLQRAASKAAKSLVEQGKIVMFKAWWIGEKGPRIKTFVARIDCDAETAKYIAEHAVELGEFAGGGRAYVGSRRYMDLVAMGELRQQT